MCPFRLVVDDDMEQLDREIAMVDADAGSTLFEEGDAADGVASIVEGTVEILKRGRVLATLGPGTVVGELSMFVPSAIPQRDRQGEHTGADDQVARGRPPGPSRPA